MREKENDIKVKIEDEDDIPFVKAAFASKAKYIITQDEKHFLSKKEEFRKYQIEVLKPKEFLKNNS
jgi:predicted nucleic acid-binding protein